ncbi:hypothetical protein Moror_11794 [Moniliophthora roreri MCA 2997]|uniref:Uncharacterized protein n=1 Tax=Moniliophthora roreri (strain MCA 2997) TaxID=1381753 RepID=V2W832_MONRO|nr:hypothetical protein Moror_11794 [Moniliophthora roreri MCA 2997]
MNRHLSAQYPNSHASQAGPRRARVSEELLIVADQIAEAVEESRRQEAILRSSAPRQQHPSQGQMIPSQSLLEPQVSAERVAEDVEELRRQEATHRSSAPRQQHPSQGQMIPPQSLPERQAPIRRAPVSAERVAEDVEELRRRAATDRSSTSQQQYLSQGQTILPQSLPERQAPPPRHDTNVPLLFQPMSNLSAQSLLFYRKCEAEDEAMRRAQLMETYQYAPAPVKRVEALRYQ